MDRGGAGTWAGCLRHSLLVGNLHRIVGAWVCEEGRVCLCGLAKLPGSREEGKEEEAKLRGS